MIVRASTLFLPTLRDDPADAEAVSHKLLVRGGYIRQVGAGLWTYMPLGWRVHRKVEQIIREEQEKLIDFLQREHPEALPRQRCEVAAKEPPSGDKSAT